MENLVNYEKLDHETYASERAAKTQFLARYSEIPGAKIIEINNCWYIVKSRKGRI